MCKYCEEEKQLETRKIKGKLQYGMNIMDFSNSGIYKIRFFSKNIKNEEKLLFQCNLNYCPFCGRNLRKL